MLFRRTLANQMDYYIDIEIPRPVLSGGTLTSIICRIPIDIRVSYYYYFYKLNMCCSEC